MKTKVTIETADGGKLTAEFGPHGRVLSLGTHALTVSAAADLLKRVGLRLYHLSLHERPNDAA